MSSNLPDDPWIPKRVHGGFRHVRRVGRGKNRRWEFKGQEPDEIVKKVLRKHKFFLITPAFPLIGSIVGLILIFTLAFNYPAAGPLWSLLEIIFGLLTVITAVYFLYNDLALWWVETTIITNKRVLLFRGLLSPRRDQIPVGNVVQVAVEQDTLLSLMLSYGDVHLYLVGGKGAVLEKIPSPKKVRDLFQRVTEEAKQSKAAKEKHPEPENTDLLAVLAKLSEKEPLPKLPNPDKKYEHLHPPHKLRGPMRTFGGPLRIPCDVHYTSDEETVMYVQRSKYVLAGRLILPIFLLLAAIVAGLYVHPLLPWISVAILVILFSIGLIVIDYIDDVFIFTTKRIIDIERKFVFFFEEHVTTEYGQIKDIKVKIGNPFFLSLDIGDVIIETPGNNPDIVMPLVDHPFSLQDMVYALKDHKQKVDKINNKNERKSELNEWFSTVLATMERKMLGRGVPNLLNLHFLVADDRARKLGMYVVPVGEDPSYPDIEPGLIVSQDPIPGTLIQFEPEKPEERPQIRVVLSGRSQQRLSSGI